jgi:hypothetical protein
MIKKFLNIHEKQDLYIIASGKSLDFFNLNFFENKISIGVNLVYKKIKTNYLLIKEFALLENCIKFLQNDQVLFVSAGNFGESNFLNKHAVEQRYQNNEKIVVFNHEKNNHRITKMPDDPDFLVVSHSTITSAIHLGAYMGAKNIILVGHDCGSINKEFNCSLYHDENTYKIVWKNGLKDYKRWLSIIEKDTLDLKQLLIQKYDCNIYSLNPFINFGLEGNVYERFVTKKIY